MTVLALLLAAAQVAQAPAAPAKPAPAPAPGSPVAPGAPVVPVVPADPMAPVAGDPAAVTFSTPAGLLLVAVKPLLAPDYEAAMAALQDLLSAASDPEHRALASGWRVYKATELDAKGNALYVHVIAQAVAGADYRPSRLLDALLAEPPDELLGRYRDAFAAPPTRLSLTELADMAVGPVLPSRTLVPKSPPPLAPALKTPPPP